MPIINQDEAKQDKDGRKRERAHLGFRREWAVLLCLYSETG